MLYSIGKFSKEIGVTTTTLRNWHNSGELIPFKITNGGTRYYSESQLNKYLNKYLNKEVEKIIIAHKDRFVRFGFDWFDSFCRKFDCTIEIVNNEKLNPQEEMVQDLISIIHIFSCRIYGLRKYKKEIHLDTEVKNEGL